jgi:hypothetical protein
MTKLKSLLLMLLFEVGVKAPWLGNFLLLVIARIKQGFLTGYQFIPIAWMDSEGHSRAGLLRLSSQGFAYGPRLIANGENLVKITLHAIKYRHFTDAIIGVRSASVYLPQQNQLLIERLPDVDGTTANYAAGHVKWHGQHNAVTFCVANNCIENGIFIGGNGSWNYYHWLIEILPKCQYIPELPKEYAHYPILVSTDVLTIPSFSYTLKQAIKGRPVIYMDHGLLYRVNSLIWLDTPSNLPFNMRGSNLFQVSYTRMRSETIAYLRHLFTPRDADSYKSPKKIFLTRKPIRRCYNQDAVEALLSQYGYFALDMEELSFVQQVAVFSHAECIVGPTGAAWTNLVFSQPGTKALCWMAGGYSDFSGYSTLAGLVGVDLRYLLYTVDIKSTAELYSKDYFIDLHRLEEAVLAFNL